LELIDSSSSSFTGINTHVAWGGLKQMGDFRIIADPIFMAFLKQTTDRMRSDGGREGAGFFQIQNYSNIIHSVAKMRVSAEDASGLVEEVKRKGVWIVNNGKPREVANTAWAFATMGVDAPDFFEALDNNGEWLVENGEPQEVTNAAWACARLGVNAPKLFAAIDNHGDWLVECGTPQALSNTVWACAKLSTQAPKLFAAVDKKGMWLVDGGSPQAVSNTALAFAKLGVQAPILLDAIEKKAEWLVNEGTPQALSNVAWACAKLGINAPKIFGALDQKGEWLLAHGLPQNVSNVAWACGTLGVEAPVLFSAIEERGEWFVENSKPQEVANTALAFAKLGIQAPKLFASIDEKGAWFVDNSTPQGVSNTAWACASLGVQAPKLFAAIEKKGEWLVMEGKPQNIATTAWAMAALGLLESRRELVKMLWNKAMTIPVVELVDDDLRQLYQVQLCVELEGEGLREGLHGVGEELRDRIKKSLFTLDVGLSKAHCEISELLEVMGVDHDNEVSPFGSQSEFDASSFLAIDMACKEDKVAIEFNGPSHYLKGGELNGQSKMKMRLLEVLGWKVLMLSYVEWEGLKDESWRREKEKKVKYLKRKLAGVLDL